MKRFSERLEQIGRLFLLGELLLSISVAYAEAGALAHIQGISLSAAPCRIRLDLSARVPFKIVETGKRTYMVALNGVADPQDVIVSGSAEPLINEVKLKRLPGDVVALHLRLGESAQRMAVDWQDAGALLVVQVQSKKQSIPHKTKGRLLSKPKKMPPLADQGENTREAVKNEETEEKEPTDTPPPPSETPPTVEAPPYTGTIDDILISAESDACTQGPEIAKALEYCRKGLFQDAILILDSFIVANPEGGCRGSAYYLRAYAHFKLDEGADTYQLLETANYFQDAISYYAQSKYAPFAMAGLGKLYLAMKNQAEAEGYFKVLLEKYPSYPGRPEVLYEMGRLAFSKKDYRKAIATYEALLAESPGSSLAADARLDLAKALYESNFFIKAIEALDKLEADDPRQIYRRPTLLYYLGNSYYQIGKYNEAREALSKVYNLFPDMADNNIVLTRIGDTYVDEGRRGKAEKIFQLVIEKYPGTDGFVLSTMRLADLLKVRSEKEELYTKIINEFPDHPMASLARLKMAELQYNEKEYAQSLATISELLELNPRALRKEVLFLEQQDYEALFKSLMEKKDYPGILQWVEKEKHQIARFENPKLFYYGGKAYFMGHLYQEALRYLAEAYKYFEKRQRPEDLIFMYGVCLDEGGRKKEALEQFEAYLKQSAKGEAAAEALRRIGNYWFTKNDYRKAYSFLNAALKSTQQRNRRIDILVKLADVEAKQTRWKNCSEHLVKAAQLLAGASENRFDELSYIYRRLGEAYLEMQTYTGAADAFTMAIKFAREEEKAVNLKYLLAESYQKGNNTERAREVYRQVIESGDPFWGKLAAEQLRGLGIQEKLDNS